MNDVKAERLYHAEQRQRYIERQIRRYKRLEAGSLDPDNQARYARKVVGWEDRLREHLDAHPELRRAQRREKVEGGVSAVERKRILKEAENRAKIENIRRQIRSDAVNKTLHRDAQGKHIPGHKNFIEGRSILTISMEEAQELVNRYPGTGEIRLTKNGEWDNQEIILTNEKIGIYVDKSGQKFEPDGFKIHYSKKGTHIVPYRKQR